MSLSKKDKEEIVGICATVFDSFALKMECIRADCEKLDKKWRENDVEISNQLKVMNIWLECMCDVVAIGQIGSSVECVSSNRIKRAKEKIMEISHRAWEPRKKCKSLIKKYY